MKKIIEKITPRQWFLYLPLIGGVGSGGYFGVPMLLELMQNQIDRVDVVIYLMCDRDQDCVEDAWQHIIERKILRETLASSQN